MAKKEEPKKPEKKPIPNHMDKSLFFGSQSTGGREKANDIKKFPATSRRIPVAKDEAHFKKQLEIEAKTKKEVDKIKAEEKSKVWLNRQGKEAEVAQQKKDQKALFEKRKKEELAKGKAASKKAYRESPDSPTKNFNDKSGPSYPEKGK